MDWLKAGRRIGKIHTNYWYSNYLDVKEVRTIDELKDVFDRKINEYLSFNHFVNAVLFYTGKIALMYDSEWLPEKEKLIKYIKCYVWNRKHSPFFNGNHILDEINNMYKVKQLAEIKPEEK